MEPKRKRSICLYLLGLPVPESTFGDPRQDRALVGRRPRRRKLQSRFSDPAVNPDDWPLHGRTYAEDRHSPLEADQQGKRRRDLGLAWSYATGTKRGMEATPIVSDGVLYATGSWSIVYALEAATGKELWRFDPQVPKNKGRDACCDVVNRGVALSKGRVYRGHHRRASHRAECQRRAGPSGKSPPQNLHGPIPSPALRESLETGS